jgi:phosphate transport system protein
MSDHIVSAFDQNMRVLAEGVERMGMRVAEQLKTAIDAIERRDLALAEKARRMDSEIDKLCDETEKRVVKILALRNPVAVDLRATIAALQISRELERVGDLAKNIAKRSAVIFQEPTGPADVAMIEMGRRSLKLLRDVGAAYRANDDKACLAVWNSDEEIDERCNSVFELVLKNLSADKSNVGASVQMLFVAKNLERIGDHATNIAEAVHFILTGEKLEDARPKHDETSALSTGRAEV